MKTILVTGGNRGIGLEICRQLDALGQRVILCARDPEKGKAAVRTLFMSDKTLVHQLDVTDEESIQHLFSFIKSEAGQLDVLVNNAGLGTSGQDSKSASSGMKRLARKSLSAAWPAVRKLKPLMQRTGLASTGTSASSVPLGEVMNIMETNFFGAWRMMQVFIPLLSKEDGRIINISSGMGQLDGLDGSYPGYRLSKSALNVLTIMLSKELHKTGIRINAICPGWVKTDMGGPDAPRTVSQGADTAVWLAMEKEIPTGSFFRDREIIPW